MDRFGHDLAVLMFATAALCVAVGVGIGYALTVVF